MRSTELKRTCLRKDGEEVDQGSEEALTFYGFKFMCNTLAVSFIVVRIHFEVLAYDCFTTKFK